MKRNEEEKKDHSKKIAAGTSLLLALALLTTSTLAYKDIEQEKINKFKKRNLDFSVVLVENFKPEDNWKSGQKIPKEVHVRNGQHSDPKDQDYENAYVRLKFSEYMEVTETKYEYSDEKYMIDKTGEFVRVVVKDKDMTEHDAKREFKDMGFPDIKVDKIKRLKGAFDEEEYFYVQSSDEDPNGQWGKKIVISLKEVEKNEQLGNLGSEDKPIPHLWSEDGDFMDGFVDKDNVFSKYVNWELGSDVITLKNWRTQHNTRPVKKWILDTTDKEEGWVYWGEPLPHINSDELNSQTSKILESVEALSFPDGEINYGLKVEMEAYSIGELIDLNISDDDSELTHTWNKEILASLLSKDELSVNWSTLQKLVDEAERIFDEYGTIPTETIGDLMREIASANEVLGKGINYADVDVVKQSVTNLEKAIKNVEEDNTILLYNQYLQASELAYDKGANIDPDIFFKGNVADLLGAVNYWKTEFEKPKSITEDNLTKAIDELKTKYYQVVKNKIEIGGYQWRVLGAVDSEDKTFTQAMLILDEPIPNKDFDKLTAGITDVEVLAGIEKGEHYIMTTFEAKDDLLKQFEVQILEKDGLYKNILTINPSGAVEINGTGGKITSLNNTNIQKNKHMISDLNAGGTLSKGHLKEGDMELLKYELPKNVVKGSGNDTREDAYWSSFVVKSSGQERRYAYTSESERVHLLLSNQNKNNKYTVRPVIWVRVDNKIDLGQEKMPALD